MESHKTLLMSYLWTKMSGFKQSFLVMIHYLIEFYLKLLDYLKGTQHILEAIFSIKASGGHIFIDFKCVTSRLVYYTF